MKRPVAYALAVVALVLLGLWLARASGAGGSTLSRDASGWSVAGAYLEEKGVEIHRLDRPLSESAPDGGVLVVVFPLQRPLGEGEEEALHRHLRRGGTLLLAFSGLAGNGSEASLLEGFRIEVAGEKAQNRSLWPWRWWREKKQGWLIRGEGPLVSETEVAWIRRPDSLPEAPAGAEVFLSAQPEGEPAISSRPVGFDFPLHKGRVLVLPADLFANGRLQGTGNGNLLEALLVSLEGSWAFDEYHHGVTDPEFASELGGGFGWGLFFLHLALFYALGLAFFGRGFGPVWGERIPAVGSASAFLRSLGTLHERLGHHRDAARVILSRARDLDPSLDPGEALRARSEQVGSAAELVGLAAEISRLQRRRQTR